jgi:hypothetical protein
MNTGTAIYNGDRVYFSDCILNQWADELEYLIAYNGRVFWVKQHELNGIQYNVSAIKGV